jgi:hypothetical protein
MFIRDTLLAGKGEALSCSQIDLPEKLARCKHCSLSCFYISDKGKTFDNIGARFISHKTFFR